MRYIVLTDDDVRRVLPMSAAVDVAVASEALRRAGHLAGL
jgi:hypothetical protein